MKLTITVLTGFSGCHFHPGCCVPDYKIENAYTKRLVWENKRHFMQSRGRLIVMRGCEWRDMLKTLERPKTHMHNILERDTEHTLLNAIKEGSVFGFLGNLCSL